MSDEIRMTLLHHSTNDLIEELLMWRGLAAEHLDRIAELEAEVAELKPYRDGYDPKKVFPPEAEWVWMRDCDDNIEPVQYNHIAEIYWNYMPGDCDELYCYLHPNDGDLRRWYPIGKLPEERER